MTLNTTSGPRATLTLPNGTHYWQLLPGETWADRYNHLLIRASHDLEDDDADTLAQLTGYAWTTAVGRNMPIVDHPVVWPNRSTMVVTASIWLRNSVTRTPGVATRDLLHSLTAFCGEGTPVRVRAPHAGTRLVPALRSALPLAFYVDQAP